MYIEYTLILRRDKIKKNADQLIVIFNRFCNSGLRVNEQNTKFQFKVYYLPRPLNYKRWSLTQFKERTGGYKYW